MQATVLMILAFDLQHRSAGVKVEMTREQWSISLSVSLEGKLFGSTVILNSLTMNFQSVNVL